MHEYHPEPLCTTVLRAHLNEMAHGDRHDVHHCGRVPCFTLDLLYPPYSLTHHVVEGRHHIHPRWPSVVWHQVLAVNTGAVLSRVSSFILRVACSWQLSYYSMVSQYSRLLWVKSACSPFYKSPRLISEMRKRGPTWSTLVEFMLFLQFSSPAPRFPQLRVVLGGWPSRC